MIRNSIGKLYTGITKNPSERVSCHNNKRGSIFTKHIQNFKIVFLENYSTLSEARKREVQVKKWRRMAQRKERYAYRKIF